MLRQVSIVLVGIGGYGSVYIRDLLKHVDSGRFQIVGAVDPYPESCNCLKELEDLKIPFYKSIDEFYFENKADLAVISTPIQYHASQSCYAMMHGSNVLCEKPICAVVQDAIKMAEVRDKTKKFLAIGYQLSFNPAILHLKKDIMEGKLGNPKKLKSIVLWPRTKKYFSRKWAAKIKDEEGNWVLDSVASNATAHYLNNMFFLLGSEKNSSARLSAVTAELYRANNIENFDTAIADITTEKGIKIMYYASHSVGKSIGPLFHYEFENATVKYTYNGEEEYGKNIIALFNNGTVINYGDPFDGVTNKLWVCIDKIAGLSDNITSNVETATPHIICINGMQDSVPEISNFPSELIKKEGDPELTRVEGLEEILLGCYENWAMPSDKGVVPWAKSGKEINLVGYSNFYR